MSAAEQQREMVQVPHDQVQFRSVSQIVAVAGGGAILALFVLPGIAAMPGFGTVRCIPEGGSAEATTGLQALWVASLFGLCRGIHDCLCQGMGAASGGQAHARA